MMISCAEAMVASWRLLVELAFYWFTGNPELGTDIPKKDTARRGGTLVREPGWLVPGSFLLFRYD